MEGREERKEGGGGGGGGVYSDISCLSFPLRKAAQ